MTRNTLILVLVVLLTSCNNSKNVNEKSEQIDSESKLVEMIDSADNYKQLDSENSTEIETVINELPDSKCNTRILLTVRENLENLNSSHVDSLLFTIDRACQNNVEFGEFSNELLFMVLEKEPELFINEFDKLINEIDTSFIFFELRNPLHDMIDVKGILEKVEKVPVDNPTKDKLIEIMKINVSRYNG